MSFFIQNHIILQVAVLISKIIILKVYRTIILWDFEKRNLKT